MRFQLNILFFLTSLKRDLIDAILLIFDKVNNLIA